jgi:hypothetical protein
MAVLNDSDCGVKYSELLGAWNSEKIKYSSSDTGSVSIPS